MAGKESAEPKKRASLWEKTIVRAFRDLQWIYKGNRHRFPEPSAEFDGKLEQALGDGIVSADDRLYLLEMKADENGKRNEWKDDPGKLPYEVLKKSLKRVDEKDDHAMHLLSMRGHLFLYWEPVEGMERSVSRHGELVVSSYLLDIAAASPASSEHRSVELLDTYSLAIKENDRLLIPCERLRAARLFKSSIRLMEKGSSEYAKPFGLHSDEMRDYVSWLINNQVDKDLPINALLASRSGSLCQYVTSVHELIDILDRLQSDHGVSGDVDVSGVEKPNNRLPRMEIELPSAPRRKGPRS